MLIPCDTIVGHTIHRSHDPALTLHHEVLYVPTGRTKRDDGLFDRDHALITDAGYFRAASEPVCLQPLTNPLSRERFGYAPDDVRYVFLGTLTGHFGHFITGSLARAWAVSRFDPATTRFVLLNHGPLSTPLAIPWLRAILVAFGLDERNLVNFPGPTRLRAITVPAPAFEEGHFVHDAFGIAAAEAGRRLVGNARDPGPPVFLTKQQLRSGVSRITNEDELCRHLAAAGVAVIAPETVPIAAQIRLFVDRPAVLGMAGSAFHTALFAPPRHKVELHVGPARLSNQILIDAATGGTTDALWPSGGIGAAPAVAGFDSSYRLSDPRQVADDLLRRIG